MIDAHCLAEDEQRLFASRSGGVKLAGMAAKDAAN
jgi:hypothetical protein